MAINIPMPDLPGNSLMKGLDTGSTLFSRYMQPILERQRMAQQGQQFGQNLTQRQAEQQQAEQHFLQEIALRRQQEARMAQNAAIERQLAQARLGKLSRESDPLKQVAYMQQILSGIRGQRVAPTQEQIRPQIEQFSGGGMPSIEEMEKPQQGQAQAQVQGQTQGQQQSIGEGLANLTPDEQMVLGMMGYKIPKITESPEQKRAAELEKSMKLAKYEHELNLADKKTQASLDNEKTRQKTIDSAKSDLNYLETTLDSLTKMKEIAEKNPDMFGHSGIFGFGAEGAAERYAVTSENPNVGAWQTYGLDPIVDAETKMSTRGNQLALKTSLANKPRFSENQKVALGKIDASINKIKKRIEVTKKMAGEVIIIDPNGRRFSTSKENAQHLPAGWKNG